MKQWRSLKKVKILLYSEGKNLFSKSGVGKALEHQKKALGLNDIGYTLDPNESHDIAHINTIGISSWKVLKNAKKKKIPVVFHTHTTSEDFRGSVKFSNQLSHVIKFWAKKLYGSADYLISPTNYTRNLISEKYTENKEIRVISNGVDLELFSKNPDLAEKFRKEFNLDVNDKVIMTAGLPFERKGILDLAKIAEELPEYKFFWFGASSIKNILPAKIRKIIENPPKNLVFPGFVDQEILLGAYSSADLFFFPTYEENEGIVILEALAMDLPILIRDIPVYEDWLTDKVNCFKGKNNQEFKEKIIEMTENKNADISSNARTVIEERQIKEVGKKYKDYYEHILKKSRV